MSGHNRQKKDGQRTDKRNQARGQDFEQAIVGSESKERASATSNLTDGNTAGGDAKRKDRPSADSDR